ncbi:MAG: 2OG-Fe(II) oxygenase, partial [Gammaproteobacteria bacterium]|nr:2OG-Fe(II) oxygenase [Gammaproteobacteria bacterium]
MDEHFITPAFNPSPNQACFCGSHLAFAQCCGSTQSHRQPPHSVHIIRGFLDATTTEKWVGLLDKKRGEKTGLKQGGEVVVSDKRVAERVFLGPVEKKLTRLMRKVFTTTIPQAMACDFEWFERPQIVRYPVGGHIWLHADNENYIKERKAWRKTSDRDVSLLLYLNDDFDGGELSFYAMNYVYKPRRGDLVFF